MKKKLLNGKLPFLIAHKPKDLKINIVKPNCNKRYFYYDCVNHKNIIIDLKTGKSFLYVGIFTIALSFLGFFLIKNGQSFLALIFTFIGVTLCIMGKTMKKKEIILNRDIGVISFPNWFYGKTRVLSFRTIKALWAGVGGSSGSLNMQLRIAPENSIKGIDINMHSREFEKDWSFMVWYMDKNRPLPPGNAFDDYRQQDFERRKAEGFPPPLYKSTFPTPEATPEQQQEREQFWKDQDHFGTSTNAWY